MEGFVRHTGKIVCYLADHVDTDRIIPARFLSMVTKTGYGELLFCDVRTDDFPLNQPEAAGASVLVVGTNFGCGSSREHAVWALQQAGFRAIVARREDSSPGYSDIFRQNAANCGLLLIELDPDAHQVLADAGTGAEVTVDLPAQTVEVSGKTLNFDIAPTSKDQLIKGLDLIGSTLEYETNIAQYERQHESYVPPSRV